MPYTRVDMDEVTAKFESLIERAKNATSGEEAFEIHKDYYKLSNDMYTNTQICGVRHDIDTTDEFYEKEKIL